MKKVRVGLVGAGGMGSGHARKIYEGMAGDAELAAVCDISAERLEKAGKMFPGVRTFLGEDELYSSGLVDGVVIATPHYQHPPLAVKAFEAGLHVLVEKPAGVYTKQVREMNEAARKSGKVFSIMFQMRTRPVFRKAKDLIESGELGEIKRMTWLCTAWYRPQSYYDSGSWRGTWEGEGGGVLLNQAPHQLDLWQWLCGVPSRIYAVCGFGKYHDIEVEDTVTILGEYGNGAECAFISSTAEAPGTNRLDISADMGRLVIEDGKIEFFRLRKPERQFNSEFKGVFGSPECWKCEVPVPQGASKPENILSNWVNGILHGETLITPGEEGLNSLEIANAAYLSSWTGEWIDIPVDGEMFYEQLRSKIRKT